MMRLRRAKPTTTQSGAKQTAPGPKGGPGGPGPGRLRKVENEVATLRRRVADLEKEVQETRHLNKRLAEITDVVAEVLLPAEERDEERLRAVLSRYDATL